MLFDTFYTEQNDKVSFSREQASRFAKEVAHDFNPIHNEDANPKLFCVPGDLLFSFVIAKHGLSKHMRFDFSGMVRDGMELNIETTTEKNFVLSDGEKSYLEVEHSGETTNNKQLIQELTCGYVKFSGQSFPDLLVKLMEENNVMINPKRPLVLYESMAIELDHLNISAPTLELSGTDLSIEGKKGVASLRFSIKSNNESVGSGEKLMKLRGLQPYNNELIEEIVNHYNSDKESYLSRQ